MLFLLTFLLVSSEVSIVRSNIQEINACFDSNVPATIDKSFVCFRQPHKCKINLAGTTLLSSTGSELGESLIIAIGTKEQLILSASSFRGETQTGPPTQSQIPDAPTKVQEAYSGKTLNDINIIVSPGNTLEIHNSEVCFDEQEADCKIYLSAGAGLSLSNAKLGERLTIISDGCLTAFSAYRSIVLSPIITTGEPVKIKTHKFEKSNKLLKEKFSSNGFVTSLTERGVIIEIPGKFFEFDSPRLLPKGDKLVKNLASALAKHSWKSTYN